MNAKKWSGGFSVASLIMAILFAVNWMIGIGQPVQARSEVLETTVPAPPAVTLPTASEPTAPTVPTEPEPEPSGPSQVYLACEAAAREMDAGHVLVYDAAAEKMLFCSTDPTDRLYPASISKLYAAMVALMYLEPEEVITAGEELSKVKKGSSIAYIKKGHKLKVEMLVEAMLMPSGNDAAFVVAAAAGRKIAGDPKLTAGAAVDVFNEEMNRQALRLGLMNSHFANPDGYHDDDHYSCPRDVAMVAALALQDPIVSKYIGMQQDSVVFESGQHITWYNTNRLLNPDSPYYTPWAVGMKTGSTKEAGNCLLAAFEKDGRQIIVGIFGAESKTERYEDALRLLEICTQPTR